MYVRRVSASQHNHEKNLNAAVRTITHTITAYRTQSVETCYAC